MELKLTTDKKKAYFVGNTYPYKNTIKAIAGNNWDKKNKYWTIPIESLADAEKMFPNIEMDADVTEAYKLISKRNSQAIAIKTIDEKTLATSVKGLKGNLYTYQAAGKAFLDTMAEGEGKILAFDMGLGKSITSLATFLDWKHKGIVDYCLVICPSPLKYSTWEKEINKWTDLEYVVVDGDKSQKIEWDDGTTTRAKGQELRQIQYSQWQFGADVIIANFELFLKDMDILPPIDSRWAIIIDECQRIKNPKAQTTKNIMKVAKRAGRRILGSGTPLENNIQELWSLSDLCKPGIFGNYYKFEDRYCEKDYWGSIVAPKIYLLPELKEKLAPIMLRKTKAEALNDLPELTIQDYWVNMTSEQKSLYKIVKDGILHNIETNEYSYLETLAQITRLQQLVDSPYLLREVLGNDKLPKSSGKLSELESIIKDLDPSRHKFILFSQYREMTDILYEWLQETAKLQKNQIGYIHGGMKPTETNRIQNEFQNGSVQCVLMTTAGNYGLDLSAGSYVICYDTLFNPQKMNQIYSRAHRNGAKQAITAINLLTKESYEERKVKILDSKKDLFNTMIDSSEDSLTKVLSKQDLLNMI